MPSNVMGALKSYSLPTAMTVTSEDPVDWATLFAGLRSSVPLTMLLGAREANAGEAEAVKRLPRYEQPRPAPTADDFAREMEHEFPTYLGGSSAAFHRMLQQALLEQMIKDAKVREGSTRRADYEQPRPAPTQFIQRRAEGGAVYADHTMPDMSDGGRLLADPHLYSGGGGVKKTLDEMEAELIKKGLRTAKAPDLSRRAFFGLPTGSSFPLAKLPSEELEKLKNAPSIEQRTTKIEPSPTAPKIEETVKKVAETPVSRRTVLKSASGQVLRGMLPEIGVPGVEDIAKSVAREALPTTIESFMAGAMARGLLWPQAVEEAKRVFPGFNPEELKSVFRWMEDPTMHFHQHGGYPRGGLSNEPEDQLMMSNPLSIMRTFTGAPPEGSAFSARPYMRALKAAAPEVYEKSRNYSKDLAMESLEQAIEQGLVKAK